MNFPIIGKLAYGRSFSVNGTSQGASHNDRLVTIDNVYQRNKALYLLAVAGYLFCVKFVKSISGPPKVSRESVIERHEAKYIIPTQLVPQIREYIRPFCDADPNGVGTPPEYVITTLQLDSPSYALHHAKENEALNRFKLRGHRGPPSVRCFNRNR